MTLSRYHDSDDNLGQVGTMIRMLSTGPATMAYTRGMRASGAGTMSRGPGAGANAGAGTMADTMKWAGGARADTMNRATPGHGSEAAL